MKNLKTPIAGLALLCAILSCKKDVQQEITPDKNQTLTSGSTQNQIIESAWNKNLTWTKVELPSHNVFYADIKTNISAETESEGAVRIFKSSTSSNPQALPFEETVNGHKYYWYYQVTEGNVMISVDVYGTQENPSTENAFKSIVLSKGAVADLEAKGNSRVSIMTLPLKALSSNQ